jgi:hypothetical protein
MNVAFYKKVKKKDDRILFLYEVEGTSEELEEYKVRVGKHYRVSDNGKPLYFTPWYGGYRVPYKWDGSSYQFDTMDLDELSSDFLHAGQDFWRVIDHASSSDIRYPKERMWSVNHGFKEGNNTKVHQVPTSLKTKLFEIMSKYNIPIAKHALLTQPEAEEEIANLNEMEAEASSDAEYDAMLDDLTKGEMDSWGEGWEWNID